MKTQDEILKAIESINESVSRETVISYIFPRLKATYGPLFKGADNEIEAWSHELHSMPIRHVRFCFKVMSSIDHNAFERYPPQLFQFKNMWENTIRSKGLHKERVAFKSALEMGWCANPCIFPAISKVGVEYFQTGNAEDKGNEFYYHYVDFVGDLVLGKKMPSIYPVKTLRSESSVSDVEWMDSMSGIAKERSLLMLKECRERLALGENHMDIIRVLLGRSRHVA